MSAILRLPPELIQFAAREPPRSLLIRGDPGAGKTTMALGLLSAYGGKRILITSRVSEEEIAHDYPWLQSEVEGQIEIIESIANVGRIESRGRILRSSAAILVGGAEEPVVDQLWLPEQVTDAFSRVPPGTSGMVVIDSWDALVEQYLGAPRSSGISLPDRAEIERLLLGLLGRGKVHLVLVLEHPEATQLDYLVDGVVACVVKSTQERLERWTHLKKMRGVRIEHAWYPYTLEGGRFLCIAPIPPNYITRLQAPQAEPDRRPDQLWPGSAEYATHFGRLRYGRATLLEVDPEVPVEAVRLFISPIQSQVLAQHGRMLVILPPSLSASDFWESVRPVITAEEFVANVRVYAPSGNPSGGPHSEIIDQVLVSGPTSEAPAMETRMPEAARFLHEGKGAGLPSLTVTWINGLRAGSAGGPEAYAPATFPALVQKALGAPMTHSILIGSPTDPYLQSLQEIATTRISIKTQSGRIFLYGVQPLTPPLVLAQSEFAGPYQLIRVV